MPWYLGKPGIPSDFQFFECFDIYVFDLNGQGINLFPKSIYRIKIPDITLYKMIDIDARQDMSVSFSITQVSTG